MRHAQAWLNDLRLQWKLGGAFGAVCVFMAVVGWVGVSTAQQIQSNLDEVGQNNLPSAIALAEIQTNLLLAQASIRAAILVDDPKEIHAYVQTTWKALSDSTTALAEYEALPISDEERLLLAPLPDAFATYTDFLQQAVPKAVANTPVNKVDAADIILRQAAAPAAVLSTNLPLLLAANENQANATLASAQSIFAQSLKVL